MMPRFQSVVYLIAFSLLGVFLLQVYFGYQVYQQHMVTLERESYRALSEAVVTANKQRVSTINELFAQDIRNPELARLKLDFEEEAPRILVIEPKTGDLHLSIQLRDTLNSTLVAGQIEEEIIHRNRIFLEEGSVVYWTDNIGERLARYSDSIQISQDFLREEIAAELDTLNISSNFELILSNEKVPPASRSASPLFVRGVSVKFDGYNSADIVLLNPKGEVLKRTGFVFLMTAIVLLLTAGSFMVLLRLNKREKQLSRLKDDFIDNVTHELLTPITTLQLAHESLRNNNSSHPSGKYLEISEQQVQRISEVVDHILQVSFVDEEHPGLKVEEVNLTNVLREVLAYHQVTADKPLDTRINLGRDRIILSDRKHLQNVFHNLIGNAIKYGPETGASLSIDISEVSDQLHIAISDNGPGIPAAEREKIFDKFHRVTNGATYEVKGLGIGLYYTRGILRQLQGDVRLTKSTPEGTTFSVTLPLKTPPYDV